MPYSITLRFQGTPELRLHSTSLLSQTGLHREAYLLNSADPDSQESFTWCPSVKIAAFLLTLAAARSRQGDKSHPLIVTRTSLLSPLAASLGGNGGALLPIFGTIEPTSELLSARIFIPANLRQRRPGPAAITIDETVLPWEQIEILHMEQQLNTYEQLSSLASILAHLIGIEIGATSEHAGCLA